MLDTNPLFYERWEHLGQSVVKQAIEDYAKLQKRLHGIWVAKDKDGYQAKEEEIQILCLYLPEIRWLGAV